MQDCRFPRLLDGNLPLARAVDEFVVISHLSPGSYPSRLNESFDLKFRPSWNGTAKP
jgi:hypothetical protein